MTRTERNHNAAALLKDRHSRSGLAYKSEVLPKNGAGAHNWGSYQQEGDYEFEADRDARLESDADAKYNSQVDDAINGMLDQQPFDMDEDSISPLPKISTGANGHVRTDKNLEEGGENKDLMKDVIATSPSDSMSSFDSIDSRPGKPGRRMSNVSEEERERARVYREGVMHKPKGSIDLANIARTSYGIAQSPPSNSNGFLATSPKQQRY